MASLSSRPVFVFVPGGMHTSAHYEPLVTFLALKGYESVAIDLPSAGDEATQAVGTEDARKVRQVLLDFVCQNGKDVVLVNHSYGGVPASQSITGLEKSARQDKPGGILMAVFLCAFLVQEGETTFGSMLRTGQTPAPWMEIMPSNPALFQPNELIKAHMFHDLDDAAVAKWVAELRPMSAAHLMSPAKQTCWDSDLPVLYIRTQNDSALWTSTQTKMFDTLRSREWTMVDLECGHEPFLSHVQELTAILIAHIPLSVP